MLCVHPESGLEIAGVKFEPNFIRLCRRLVRDSNFRGSTPEFTFSVWDGVRKNENENIFPFMPRCDDFIDTTLEYEMNILAPYLRSLLSGMDKGDEHYRKSAEILDMIKEIEGISSAAVGEKSLYKEFV